MSSTTLGTVLLAGAVVLLVAVVAVRLSVRAGLPSLLLYLAIGMVLGEAFGVDLDDPALAQALGLGALVVILAEGGLTTRWHDIRPTVPTAAALATLGVGITVAVVAVAGHLVLGLDWRGATLLGAVVSSTDVAAVFSMLRHLRLPKRLVGLLEAESGFNDAPAVILVTLLSEHGGVWPPRVALLVVFELAVGAAIGLLGGLAGTYLLRRAALPAAGLYPLAALAIAVASYGAASSLHASGFLAVYLTALWLGNADLPHRRATLGFAEGLAWLAQIGLFVMLGLLASPGRLPSAVLPALAVGAVLLLVARPAAVLACGWWSRLSIREQAFLSWAGLRGAVPIVLATIPLTEGRAEATRVFDVVFVLVVMFTLVQGPTLAPMARLLRVVAPAEARELTVESAPLEDMRADLLQLRIPPRSRLNGVEVWELRLPPGAVVTLVVRHGEAVVPAPTTVLRTGDQMLVVATKQARDMTEQRLRAVSRRGKLAGWFGERGAERPPAG